MLEVVEAIMNVEELAVYSRVSHELVGLVKFVDGVAVGSKGVDVIDGTSIDAAEQQLDMLKEVYAVRGEYGDHKLDDPKVGEGADYRNARWHADPWADSKG